MNQRKSHDVKGGDFRPAILIQVSGNEREDDAKLIEGDLVAKAREGRPSTSIQNESSLLLIYLRFFPRSVTIRCFGDALKAKGFFRTSVTI